MTLKCEICNTDITKKEYDYSIKNFKKALCREHHEDAE